MVAATLTFEAHYAIPNAAKDLALDFRVFLKAATVEAHLIYQTSHMPFVYPPTALALFSPLALLDADAGFVVWTGISILAFCLAVAAVVGWRVAGVSLLGAAAIRGIILGQSAMLLSAAMFAALRLPPLARGAVFGALLAIKPQIVLFAPLAFLVRREWRVLHGLGVAAVVLIAGSIAFMGWHVWVDWFQALPQFRKILVEDGVLSRVITPAGRAEFAGLPLLPFVLAGGLIGAAAVFVMSRRLENEQLIALIVAASLLASPYAHVHDSVGILPACAVLMLRGPWWLALPAAMVFMGPPGWVMLGLQFGLLGCVVGSILDNRIHTAAAIRDPGELEDAARLK